MKADNLPQTSPLDSNYNTRYSIGTRNNLNPTYQSNQDFFNS